MKRYLTLLLILVMTVALCACGQNEPSDAAGTSGSAASAAEDSGSEADADTGSQDKQEGVVEIEITPPDGWTPVEGSVIPVQYMKGTASFMVKEEPFAGATLDEVVSEALEIYQGSFDNVTVQGEAEPFTVDGKDARTLTFTCTISNLNMKFLYVYLFAADKTFVITFGDQESTFDSLTGDYETILSNIRFITK